jgi:hydroxymethylbilane synthase
MRGNVDTRVEKLLRGDCGALVLALAGLQRLDIRRAPYRPVEASICLPAVGQGALAVETRAEDTATVRAVALLDDAASRAAVTAERAFLRRLGGGCMAPATAYARFDGGELVVDAIVGDPDGRELLRDGESAPAADAIRLGEAIADRMLGAGAERILTALRGG